MLKRDDKLVCSPSHGENRGSSPLGSANKIKHLFQNDRLVSNDCPINMYGQIWTACRFFKLSKSRRSVGIAEALFCNFYRCGSDGSEPWRTASPCCGFESHSLRQLHLSPTI